jgi:hypothetical protein
MVLYKCVDYCGLNRFTIKKSIPLLITWLLDPLNHVKVFTKVELHGAYNLVHIWEGDEWKITFRIHHGDFEYIVMPFGLTNLFFSIFDERCFFVNTWMI